MYIYIYMWAYIISMYMDISLVVWKSIQRYTHPCFENLEYYTAAMFICTRAAICKYHAYILENCTGLAFPQLRWGAQAPGDGLDLWIDHLAAKMWWVHTFKHQKIRKIRFTIQKWEPSKIFSIRLLFLFDKDCMKKTRGF